MSAPETICDFEVQAVPTASHYGAPSRAMYVCKTHGMRDFDPSSTVTEFGAFTLCPVGKVEYAVQRGIERINDHVKNLK